MSQTRPEETEISAEVVAFLQATNPKLATALTRERLEVLRMLNAYHDELESCRRTNKQLLEAAILAEKVLARYQANLLRATNADLRNTALGKLRAAIAAAEGKEGGA